MTMMHVVIDTLLHMQPQHPVACMATTTPHLQYVSVLTPLLLLVSCSTGCLLLSVVTGGACATNGYGPALLLILMYTILYWLRDGAAEDADGVLLHIGSVSVAAGVAIVVVSEGALFTSILWAVVAVLTKTGHEAGNHPYTWMPKDRLARARAQSCDLGVVRRTMSKRAILGL